MKKLLLLLFLSGCADVPIIIGTATPKPETVYDPPPPNFRFETRPKIEFNGDATFYNNWVNYFKGTGLSDAEARQRATEMMRLK